MIKASKRSIRFVIFLILLPTIVNISYAKSTVNRCINISSIKYGSKNLRFPTDSARKKKAEPSSTAIKGISSMSLHEFFGSGAGSASLVFIDEGGKSGFFRFDPNDNTTISDSAMVLVYSGKRYKRVTDYVTPEMFGAKRDGIANDFNSIQKALDFVSRNGGGKVVFLPGTYVVGSTLKLTPINKAPSFNYNIMLSGSGIGTTEIKGGTGISGNLLEMTYGQTKFEGKDNRVVIRDITFAAGTADRCFYADFVSQLRLEDCSFIGGQEYTAQIGSDDPTRNYSTYITRCYFGGWTTTAGLNKGTLVVKNSLFIAIDQMETDGGRIGVDFYNSAACIVTNSKIEGCKYAGIRMRGTSNGEHRITNNYIICYGGWDFNAQYDGEMHGILIQGNRVGSLATNTIANNVIRVASPQDLNSVMVVSDDSKLQHNPTDYLIKGVKSGATGHIWGVNKATKSLAIKVESGKFLKGESIVQLQTGGKAVLKEIVNGVSYGIKLEGNNGSNNISGNQLTTQPSYGIYINSDSNMIIGNTIGGATGIYSSGNSTSVMSNMFWSVKPPRVAIEKVGGSNFTSLNNNTSGGAILGVLAENVISKSLETQGEHIMSTANRHLTKITRSGKDIFGLSNQDSSEVNLVGLNGATIWLGNSENNDLRARTLGVTPSKVIVIKDIPSSSVGLPSGAVWVDKDAGNILKIVP